MAYVDPLKEQTDAWEANPENQRMVSKVGAMSLKDRVAMLADKGVDIADVLATQGVSSLDKLISRDGASLTEEDIAELESKFSGTMDEELAPVEEDIVPKELSATEMDTGTGIAQLPQGTPATNPMQEVFDAEKKRKAAMKPPVPEREQVEKAGLYELAKGGGDPDAFATAKNFVEKPDEYARNYVERDKEFTKNSLLEQWSLHLHDPEMLDKMVASAKSRSELVQDKPLVRAAVASVVQQPIPEDAIAEEVIIREDNKRNWLDVGSEMESDLEAAKPNDIYRGTNLSPWQKNVIEVIRGGIRGPIRGLEETADTVGDLWDEAEFKMTGGNYAAIQEANQGNVPRLVEHWLKAVNEDLAGPESDSLYGQIPELMTSFIFAFRKYSAVAEATPLLAGQGIIRTIMRNYLAGAAASGTTTPTEIGSIAPLIKMFFPTAEDGTVNQFVEDIQLGKDDTEAMKRLKIAAVDGGFGIVFDALLQTLKPVLRLAAEPIKKVLRRDEKVALMGDRYKAVQKFVYDLHDSTAEEIDDWLAWNAMPQHELAFREVPNMLIPEDLLVAGRKFLPQEELAVDIAKGMSRRIYTDREKKQVMSTAMDDVADAANLQVRPFGSTMEVLEDGSGVKFNVMMGRDSHVGISGLDDALEAAAAIDPSFASIQLYKVNVKTGMLELFEPPGMTPFELYRDLVRVGNSTEELGEFYVRAAQTRLWHPTDALLFGENSVIHGGMLNRYLFPPRMQFAVEWAEQFSVAFHKESTIVPVLQSIVKRDFFGQTFKVQREAQALLTWAEAWGKTNGRTPTLFDLMAENPDVSANAIKAYQAMRSVADTLYEVNNAALHRDWSGQGFKTIYNKDFPDALFDGKLLERRGVKAKAGYDPSTKEEVVFTKDYLNDLYARGGYVMEMALPVARVKHVRHTMVVVDPDRGWVIGALRRNPLEKIPGWVPRIYKDKFYVQRVVVNGRVNGAKEELRETVAVAGTLKEANVRAAKSNAKALARGEEGVSYVVRDDRTMLNMDRSVADLEMMRVEGRLFFDDRSEVLLNDVYGKPAQLVDPVPALQRAIWATGRSVTHEELVRVMKGRFQKQFGSLLGGRWQNKNSVTVTEELKALSNSADVGLRKQIKEAQAMWDYIRVIEGSNGGDMSWVRAEFMNLAEWLDNTVFLSGKAGRAAARGVNYVAREFKPLQSLRKLAFFDFLTTRPGRQLVLQSSQHMFLAPLDPVYFMTGKWMIDSLTLLGSVHPAARKGVLEWGEQTGKRGAKIFGVTVDEYKEIVNRFHRSGRLQTINNHSFGGGVPDEAVFNVPKGMVGDAVANVGDGLNTINTVLKKGFDTGEALNSTASWLMAFRKYREKVGKKVSQFSEKDWANINQLSKDYAFAMDKTNASKYQTGFLALPTQFLSFTHKAWMTIAGFNPAMKGADLLKIRLGQLFLFGTSAFGLREPITEMLANAGVLTGDDSVQEQMIETVLGGVLDKVLTEAFEMASDDGHVAWGDFLSPTGGIFWLMQKAYQVGHELSFTETMAGPSFASGSRLWTAYNLARASLTLNQDVPIEERAAQALDIMLAGGASGYNDWYKQRLAAKAGEWKDTAGRKLGVPYTDIDGFLKVALGLSVEPYSDAYLLKGVTIDRSNELRETAKDIYNKQSIIMSQYYSGENTLESTIRLLQNEVVLLSALDEEDQVWVKNRIAQMDMDNPDSTATKLADHLRSNGTDSEGYTIYLINKNTSFSTEEKVALIDLVKRISKEQPEAGAQSIKNLELQIQQLQDTQKGEK